MNTLVHKKAAYGISCKKHAEQRTTLTALEVMFKTFKKGLTVTI